MNLHGTRAAVRRVGARWLTEAAGRVLAAASPWTGDLGSGVWLFGGSVGAAYNDNSAAVHRYVVANHPEIEAYWVMDPKRPDYGLARSVGPVLPIDAVRTAAIAQRAQVHVISHGLHDIPMSRSSRALKVRVGHGITALKRTKPPPLRSLARTHRRWDLVPVSSSFEADIKREWQIRDDAIEVCGVPRFDELLRRTASPSSPRRVLYMPTWRAGAPERADQREVVRQIQSFVGHPYLLEVLRAHDAVLDVCVHRLMHSALIGNLGRVQNERIRVASNVDDLQGYLAAACVLVTDYSSVTWDILFLGRPVLFYTFDLARFEREHGAYIDLRTDLPGPRFDDADGVVAGLDRALADPSLGLAAQRWRERMFPFQDDQSCRRVVEAIQRRLQARETR